MSKRFYTDYPLQGHKYDGRWRRVHPISYDTDKYVRMDDGEEFKLGYLRHGRPGGPQVSRNYAKRFFLNTPSALERIFSETKGDTE